MAEVRDIEEWQIELRKKDNDPFEMDELNVYVTPSAGAEKKHVEEEIREKMLQATEVAPNAIYCIPIDEIVKRLELETANKEKRIVDARPKI